MNAPAAILALSLLAATPYPPPKVAQASDSLKSDTGAVVAVDAGVSEMRVNTPAGLVVFKVSPNFPVLTSDGKPAGVVSSLHAGQRVRVYYTVDNGAQVQELDLE